MNRKTKIFFSLVDVQCMAKAFSLESPFFLGPDFVRINFFLVDMYGVVREFSWDRRFFFSSMTMSLFLY